jgi:hypothetical protein
VGLRKEETMEDKMMRVRNMAVVEGDVVGFLNTIILSFLPEYQIRSSSIVKHSDE